MQTARTTYPIIAIRVDNTIHNIELVNPVHNKKEGDGATINIVTVKPGLYIAQIDTNCAFYCTSEFQKIENNTVIERGSFSMFYTYSAYLCADGADCADLESERLLAIVANRLSQEMTNILNSTKTAETKVVVDNARTAIVNC